MPLEPGLAPLRGNGKHFGPEVAFAQAMTKHLGQPIGIITGGLGAVDDRKGYAQIVKTVKEGVSSCKVGGKFVQ